MEILSVLAAPARHAAHVPVAMVAPAPVVVAAPAPQVADAPVATVAPALQVAHVRALLARQAARARIPR